MLKEIFYFPTEMIQNPETFLHSFYTGGAQLAQTGPSTSFWPYREALLIDYSQGKTTTITNIYASIFRHSFHIVSHTLRLPLRPTGCVQMSKKMVAAYRDVLFKKYICFVFLISQ